MTRYLKIETLSLLALITCAPFALARASGHASNQDSQGTVAITTVVSVIGSKDTVPPPIDKRDVNVFTGKTRLNVTGWVPADLSNQGKLELAILIDNDVRTTILGRQMDDLNDFLNSLGPNVSVAIFYAQYGAATMGVPFSADHKAVTQELHLSEGKGGDSPSIYLSLADLVEHWKPDGVARHEVLVLTSGIDALHTGVQDPYFDSTMDKAQRAGVEVYSIFDGSSRYGFSFGGEISQGKLIEMATDTGGQAYMQGPTSPITISGYLNELGTQLNHQYLLTFTTDLSKHPKGDLLNIEVRLEPRDVKTSYPQRVFVPGKDSPKD